EASTPRKKRMDHQKHHKAFKREDKQLAEIFRLQNSTSLQIPKAAFQRLVKDILEQLNEEERKFEVPRYATQEEHAPFRMESQALFALQEAAEHYLTGLMEDGNLCAIHNKRVTLMTKDLEIVSRLRHRKI
ncbi:unnamed protein product, partial [Effrenium voratum]